MVIFLSKFILRSWCLSHWWWRWWNDGGIGYDAHHGHVHQGDDDDVKNDVRACRNKGVDDVFIEVYFDEYFDENIDGKV